LFFLTILHDFVQLLSSLFVSLISRLLRLNLFLPLCILFQLVSVCLCYLSLYRSWVLHFDLRELCSLSVIEWQLLVDRCFDFCIRCGLFVLLGEVIVGLRRARLISLRPGFIEVLSLLRRWQVLLSCGSRWLSGWVEHILLVEDRVTELGLNC
jgi:hypothetical protein